MCKLGWIGDHGASASACSPATCTKNAPKTQIFCAKVLNFRRKCKKPRGIGLPRGYFHTKRTKIYTLHTLNLLKGWVKSGFHVTFSSCGGLFRPRCFLFRKFFVFPRQVNLKTVGSHVKGDEFRFIHHLHILAP